MPMVSEDCVAARGFGRIDSRIAVAADSARSYSSRESGRRILGRISQVPEPRKENAEFPAIVPCHLIIFIPLSSPTQPAGHGKEPGFA